MFVRADLGQIEPRVLAAVSGDRGARRGHPRRRPVRARRRAARRATGRRRRWPCSAAMYGQTTGHGRRRRCAGWTRPTRSRWPTCARRDVERSGRARPCARTAAAWSGLARPTERSTSARRDGGPRPRGRFARNAMVQGAAAELFKVWAVTVRGPASPGHGARDRAVPARRAAGARAERGGRRGGGDAAPTCWARRRRLGAGSVGSLRGRRGRHRSLVGRQGLNQRAGRRFGRPRIWRVIATS